MISVSSLSFRHLVALGEAVQSFKVSKVWNKTSIGKALALSLWLVDVLFLIAKMIHHLPLLNPTARHRIISDIALLVLPQSPFFTPIMKTGTPFQYEMTNCGELGWVSDIQGYRYTKYHPYLGTPWAKLPRSIREIINFLKSQEYIPAEFKPEACLINKYLFGASLGKHQDNTEKDLTAPIISISLGAPGIFLLGGTKRNEPMTKYLLKPGDIFIMSEGDRNRYHAFKGITHGEKRVNLTIRQVNFHSP